MADAVPAPHHASATASASGPAGKPDGQLPQFSTAPRGSLELVSTLALTALALWLISRWAQVWWTNPDLGHGWLVPLLTALLLRERWADRPAPTIRAAFTAGAANEQSASRATPATRCAARRSWLLLALPTAAAFVVSRLLLEPFPQWPLVLWVFSALGYALILALLSANGGVRFAKHFVWPLVFSATALPWPGIIDNEIILPLRTGLAWIAAEIANMTGHPAIAHGTVIEIGRGFVGVDEACSGVRSLQTALAVSLFQGEWYRLSGLRRLALLGVGLGIALATNLARTVFLSLQSAWHGAAGVERWHDNAGTAQLIVCLGALLFIGWRWSRHGKPPAQTTPPLTTPSLMRTPSVSAFATRLAITVLAFIVVLEIGTRWWFYEGARTEENLPQWQITLPTQRPDFKAEPFTPNMQTLLGCDAHQLGQWRADDGTARSGYIIDWDHGQAARFTPSLHDPTVCLPMSGSELVTDHGTSNVTIGALTFPFHAYTFSREGAPYHVFYLAWDLTTHQPLQRGAANDSRFAWFTQQWQDVRDARRDLKARVIGLAIYGAPDLAAARAALEIELAELARVAPR